MNQLDQDVLAALKLAIVDSGMFESPETTVQTVERGLAIVSELRSISSLKLSRGKHEYPINFDRITPALVAKAAAHGIKQKMQDKATSGGKDTSEAVYVSQAQSVLDTLYQGDWGEKAESMDPVTRLVYNMARGAALTAFKTQHSRDPDHKNKSDMSWMQSKTDEVIKKNPALLEQAKALLAIQITL